MHSLWYGNLFVLSAVYPSGPTFARLQFVREPPYDFILAFCSDYPNCIAKQPIGVVEGVDFDDHSHDIVAFGELLKQLIK